MDTSNRVALLIGQDDTVCSITTTHRPRPFHRATDGTLGQWLRIERTLGAAHTTEPIDTFLRDVLRWRTGAIHGLDRVYEGFVGGRCTKGTPLIGQPFAENSRASQGSTEF